MGLSNAQDTRKSPNLYTESKFPAKKKTLPQIGTGPLRIQVQSVAKESQQLQLNTDSGHAYIQQTWSTFSNLGDAERNQLLKGLISRCSTKQIQMICTCLNLKNVDSIGGKQFVPEDIYGKYLVKNNQKKSAPPPQEDSYQAMARVMSSNADQTDSSLNSNLYIKLLNSSMDAQTVIKQMAKAGPESMKFLINFLSERCTKFHLMLKAILGIALEIENSRASERLFDCIIEATEAKYATLYRLNPASKALTVESTNWKERPIDPNQDNTYAFRSMLKGDSVNVCNVQSADGFSNQTSDYYIHLDPECIMSAPIFGDGMRTIGFIELINKKSGNPYFTAEDEFMMRVLSGFGTLLQNHAKHTEQLNKKQNEIKQFLSNTSQMKSETNMGDLIHVIMGTARELVTAERCTLFMIDRENQQLWSKVAQGSSEIRFPLNQGIAGFVATTGEILNIPDAYADSRFNRSFDIKTGFRTRNILATPMLNSKGEIIGVFQAINKLPEDVTFTKEDVAQITSFSSLASTIEKSLEHQNIQAQVRQLRNNQLCLSSIIQTMPYCILVIGEDGRCVYTSNSELYELRNLSTMKLTSYQHWLGADNFRLVDEISKAIITNKPVSGTNCKLIFENGVISVNYYIAPLSYHSELDFLADKKKEATTPQEPPAGTFVFLQKTSTDGLMKEILSKQVSFDLMDKILKRLALNQGFEEEMTIMCVDIRGFTKLSGEIGAERTFQYLNQFHDAVAQSVEPKGGIIIQKVADSCVIVFGVPKNGSLDAIEAVGAAMHLQNSMDEVNVILQSQTLPAMTINIGIATGKAIFGPVGSQNFQQYQVIGETMNVANVMQKMGKAYGSSILVDSSTREIIKEKYYIRQLDVACQNETSYVLYDVYGSTDQNLKHDTMTTMVCFDLGIKEYKLRNWQSALMHFKKCITLSDDQPSRAFVERCKGFIDGLYDVPEEWDGVWRPIYKVRSK